MPKKIFAIVLAAAVLALFCAPALAAGVQPAQYRIATTAVNVRSGPNSAKYPAIGYLVKGELVEYLGRSGAWSKIYYKNSIGYVFSEYLTDPINQAVKFYRYASEPVNVRSGPDSSKYPVIGVLKKQEKIQYLGDTSDWALVYYKGNIGFVYGKYLSASPGESEVPSAQAQYRIATTAVNVRSGPNSSQYPSIGFLVKGELVKFLGKSGTWSKISYKNSVGYVFSKYLTDPVNQAVKYYRYATEPVNVRSGPDSTQYPVTATLKKGEKVQYLGDVGAWALVYYKGDIGFVYNKYLSGAAVGGDTTPMPKRYVFASTTVNVRLGPGSANYKVIATLKKGEKAEYLGSYGGWSQIMYKGKLGYVFTKYLVS